MSTMQNGTMVKAFLKLQNIDFVEEVTNAVKSYFSSMHGNDLFSEIRNGGINNNELILIFIAPEQTHTEVAESVHQFLSSFMDEFYDDSLEDDWLNEMDCDEIPIIVSYEVTPAEDYIEENIIRNPLF